MSQEELLDYARQLKKQIKERKTSRGVKSCIDTAPSVPILIVRKDSDGETKVFVGGRNGQVLITKSKLLAMLRREQEMRVSPITQDKYRQAELDEDTDWMEVTLQLQRDLIREFGYSPEEEEYGLQLLRSAQTLFPDDEEVKNSVLYLKYNKARQGPLREGEPAPDIPVRTMSGEYVSLFQNQFISAPFDDGRKKPIAIVAGSWT